MEMIQAIALGFIQGLTEFLPISSSGHLVLFQRLFGMKEPELFFNISVHAGTLVAVIIYFWKDLKTILISVIRFVMSFLRKEASSDDIRKDPDLKLAMLIIVGTIPTAIIGLLFHEIADQIFSSVFIVGLMLMITGTLLWTIRGAEKEGKAISGFSIRNALIIGVVQGLAILPGISRSGSTIAAGLFMGLNRETSARYSFLLSIPAIVGAEILSLKDMSAHHMDMGILWGTLTAGIVGYFALSLLVYIVKKGQLHFFSPYCWVVGMIALVWGW